MSASFVNEQPAEHLFKPVGGCIEVHSIWPTIQGEGPFAGTPAVFIRLAGCNLQCPFCDTDYTSHREMVTPEKVIELVRTRCKPTKRGRAQLVVITGGEPFRQSIGILCNTLLSEGYHVQIETNGTLNAEEHMSKRVYVVCSPKAPKVHQWLQPRITALKYVMSADNVSPVDGLPTSVLGLETEVARPWPDFHGQVYLQPEDHYDQVQNKKNMDAVVASCMKYGYRLCLQLHKIIGLD
jgi:7-carboxy-7-deazaguanine synthase